jgi:hypothetical protein
MQPCLAGWSDNGVLYLCQFLRVDIHLELDHVAHVKYCCRVCERIFSLACFGVSKDDGRVPFTLPSAGRYPA